jgi:hypothetical protein
MKPYDPEDRKNPRDIDLDDESIDSTEADFPTNRNQGEGDRASARRYDSNVESFVREGRVGAAARDAARAVDSDEGPSLRAAEEEGKARAKMSRLDTVKSIARAFVAGAKEAYAEARGRRDKSHEPSPK